MILLCLMPSVVTYCDALLFTGDVRALCIWAMVLTTAVMLRNQFVRTIQTLVQLNQRIMSKTLVCNIQLRKFNTQRVDKSRSLRCVDCISLATLAMLLS